MVDDRKRQDRPVVRAFQRHRLEEQLWSLAYQHILPVICKRAGAKNQQRCDEQTRIHAKGRRA